MEDKTEKATRDARGRFLPGAKIGKQFVEGQSGNPNGRPKRTRLTDALREKLQQDAPDAPEQTVAEIIADVLIREAKSGNVQAIREIADRTEGKPAQKVDVDMNVLDWRALAAANGVSTEDVIQEAKLLIESADDSSR